MNPGIHIALRLVVASASLFGAACAANNAPHASPIAVAPRPEINEDSEREQSAASATSHNYRSAVDRSNLATYQLTGATWVDGMPLLVNRDFDFAMAMSLPDIGPAIAAGQRLENNKKVAALFDGTPIDFAAEFEADLDKCGPECAGASALLAGKTPVLFGLLYGHEDTRLQVILEVHEPDLLDRQDGEKLEPLRFIIVSNPKPLTGEGSWTATDGAAVASEVRQSVARLLAVANSYQALVGAATVADAREALSCPIGDREKTAVEALAGQKDVRKAKGIPRTYLVCR